MEHLWDVGTPLLVAAVVALVGYVVRLSRAARRRERERDDKIDRLVTVFLEGTPPDPFTGVRRQPSVVEQLAQLDKLWEAVARTDVNVAEIRTGLIDASRESASDRRRLDRIESAVSRIEQALRDHNIELPEQV